MKDSFLSQCIHEWQADPQVLAAVLTGSRAAGFPDAESDYDITLILTEDAYQANQTPHVPGALLDIVRSSLSALRELAEKPGWWTPGFVGAKVLFDKTGQVEAILKQMVSLSPDKAHSDTAGWLDAYLNSFYRAMKAARRRNALAAHLHAAESMQYLLKTLFSLHGTVTPYYDRLQASWGLLTKVPWRNGGLERRIHHILRTADPTAQQKLEAEVEELMRSEGYGHVIDAWGGELERVRSFRFG
ncbi:MAG: hypothetical protein ACUVRO_04045 [Armatimonadota bacterium]